MLDVTPLSLGVEVEGGMVDVVVPRNTTIPYKKTKTYTTAQDNQQAVTIHVVQGERPMAADNKSLGMFNLEGIPPMRRGEPQIEVTFDIDANGILHVSAKEKTTGKEQKVTNQGATNLSEEEIERMKQEAEKHAEEDRKRRELIETKNKADALIYSTEKSLKDFADKVTEDEKKEIQEAIEKLKKAMEGNSKEEIEKAMESLARKSHKLAEEAYKKAQAEGGTQESTSQQQAKKDDEEVVEAEVEEDNK